MKVCLLLMCFCCLCWRTKADSRSFLITAPLSLCLDATETVLLQLFGFTEDVTVHVFLRTSMAENHRVLAREEVRLTAGNNHQAIAKVRLFTHQLDKSVNNVILHVQSQSAEVNGHVSVPVTRSNGFLFIQTDKPLYTPHQSVKVRAFSLNQELRPADRSVFLTFKDPDHVTVDIVEMIDVNNGIPSMQNPFKIPIKPKLGIWSIEASYSDTFTTKARTDFEVREYVLPSFSISVEPQANYISYGHFNRFHFKVSARYLHGAPVADAEVFLRYGYVSGKDPPVIIPNSVRRDRLSSSGEVDVTVNMGEILSKHDGPKNLNSLFGKYLYIAVLLQEDGGGISQEVEFASVKFVKSPFTLSLVSTPPFIKPGLPYNIQVLVKDHLNKPVNRVPVQLVQKDLYRQGMETENMLCSDNAASQSDGLAVFVCNTPRRAVRAVLQFETADPSLPSASQASLTLTAAAYHSENERYIYIDPPLPGHSLEVGKSAHINVYSATPSYLPIRVLSYLVLSKGKVVHFGSRRFVDASDNKQTLNFPVTGSMVPSIRLLVYYILYGEGTSELVADSVWIDVRHKCVSGLQTDLSFRRQAYKPKDNLQLDIRANQEGLLALSAVDTALFTLRPNYKDPVSTVLRHIEHSDLGCGGGGGKNNADVFRLAGLTFITNANVKPITSSEACTAVVRPKRALTDQEKEKKAKTYGPLKTCCEQGMKYIPKSVTCLKFAEQIFRKLPRCRQAFRECCEFVQQNLDHNLILGRHEMGADFDQTPTLVRSAFPESWLWEVQRVSPGQTSISRPLPDSLTTWEIKAIGMFKDGICVAEPVQVPVSQPLSVDVPLPYQVVRGEQVELSGSVYNQQAEAITFCVTLTAGPGICLLNSQPTPGGEGLRSTPCHWSRLSEGGAGEVTFTVLGLEPGEHNLTFTLKTRTGGGDILRKKLRVVPEGVRDHVYSGGTLDPRGLYGKAKQTVHLKNNLPANIIPNTAVERMLTISGEVLEEIVSVVHDPDGLRELINLPTGSADRELEELLLFIHVYQYLETTSSWGVVGGDVLSNSARLSLKISQGLVSISSFRRSDSSYSRWTNQLSSTWMTARVVQALIMADQVIRVDHQSLSNSVTWLIHNTQQPDGSFREKSLTTANKIMSRNRGLDQSVYLTSFVMIALHGAGRINNPNLQLQLTGSMRNAANYISQHAPAVTSVHVRAMATYALTLHDPEGAVSRTLFTSLEKVVRQKGDPVELRFWQESSVTADQVKPDQSSGLAVETTAYVLLTVLLKGQTQYARPIVTWLTQDQHYGEAFYSIQDTVLTLAALTEYTKAIRRATLNQEINMRYSKAKNGALGHTWLTQSRSVATPIKVTKADDIIVSTNHGTGVSVVKLKTVYYRSTTSTERCNFDTSIEIVGSDVSEDLSLSAPHLVACAKYKPLPNEVNTDSSMTVMNIQLPTGLEANLDDLRQFRDLDEPLISHYELKGNTVVITMDSVPSDVFLCVGFRVRTGFKVSGASESLFQVYEPLDKGSMCTKQFSNQEQKLQRLCLGVECQCLTAACAAYRGNMDLTLTVAKRMNETCQPHISYAFKVDVKSSAAEGDFMTYTATVVEVMKNIDKTFDEVRSRTEVDLVKKATCSAVDIQIGKQYLVMGASGSEVTLSTGSKFRFALDSEALVELLPTDCNSSPDCADYISQLEEVSLKLLVENCQDSS
ncbi:complement C5 [Seriola dumerili]|uniref:complement C5 n=1 Tax=Seriola dumerili TaxID=41447 RepID=UPI000BBE25DD|nr:complement C5 [Seriola dumerili]